jgi:hypothetical protein
MDSGSKTDYTHVSIRAGFLGVVRDGNVISFGDCDYMFFTPTGFIQLLKRLKKEEEEGEGEEVLPATDTPEQEQS